MWVTVLVAQTLVLSCQPIYRPTINSSPCIPLERCVRPVEFNSSIFCIRYCFGRGQTETCDYGEGTHILWLSSIILANDSPWDSTIGPFIHSFIHFISLVMQSNSTYIGTDHKCLHACWLISLWFPRNLLFVQCSTHIDKTRIGVQVCLLPASRTSIFLVGLAFTPGIHCDRA